MNVISPSNLPAAVTQAVRSLVSGPPPATGDQAALLEAILERGQQGAGFHLLPTPAEETAGLPLPTGEMPRTRLLGRSAFELEGLRLLALLGRGQSGVERALFLAEDRLTRQCFASVCTTGECRGASIAWLRFHQARGGPEGLIRTGLGALAEARTSTGRWKGFPFFYTLLWLLELPASLASGELLHTGPACRSLLAGLAPADPQAEFRRLLLERALAQEPLPAV